MTATETLVPMSLFALATSATPGPVNVISAMCGARFGPIRSLPYVFGATTSFVAILLLVGAGFSSIVGHINHYSTAFTIGGSVYMLYLAWRIAASRGDLEMGDMDQPRPGFRAGLLTQAINPKAWIVALSAITIYVGPHLDYTPRLLVFSVVFFLICAMSLAAWTLVGARVASLTGNVALFNRLMAGLLAVSIVLILAEELAPR